MRQLHRLILFSLAACGGGHGTPEPPPPDATPVNITSDAAFVAFQDGDATAPWVSLSPTSATSYQGMVTGDTYAVAIGCVVQPSAGTSTVNFYYQTTDDPALIATPCTPPASADVAFQIAPAVADAVIQVYVGSENVTPPDNSDDTVAVPKGVDDVLAVFRTDPAPPQIYRSSVDIEGFATIAIDTSQALVPIDHPVTVNGGDDPGLTTDGVQIFTNYFTAHAAGPINVLLQTNAAPTAAMSYQALDPSQSQPGDLLQVQAYAQSGTATTMYIRSASQLMAQPASPTLTLPSDLLIAINPTIDRSPDPRVSLVIPTTGGTLANVTYFASVSSATVFREVHISATRAQMQVSLSVETPDLSGLANYAPALALDVSVPQNLRWVIGRNEVDVGALADGQRSMYTETSQLFFPAAP